MPVDLPWVPVGFLGIPWNPETFRESYGMKWKPLETYGTLWNPMDSHGVLSISIQFVFHWVLFLLLYFIFLIINYNL